ANHYFLRHRRPVLGADWLVGFCCDGGLFSVRVTAKYKKTAAGSITARAARPQRKAAIPQPSVLRPRSSWRLASGRSGWECQLSIGGMNLELRPAFRSSAGTT